MTAEGQDATGLWGALSLRSERGGRSFPPTPTCRGVSARTPDLPSPARLTSTCSYHLAWHPVFLCFSIIVEVYRCAPNAAIAHQDSSVAEALLLGLT